jgi:DNA-binding CsgD family transcriptional regulator
VTADSRPLVDHTERALVFARAAGEPTTEVFAQGLRAHLELARGDADAALVRMRAAHARALAAGAGLALGWAVSWLALAQAAVGELASARTTLEQAISTGIDEGVALVIATACLADILRVAGDPAAAQARASEALAIAERVGAPGQIALAKESLGRVTAARGDWARAEALLHEALTIRIDNDLLLWVPQTFDALAEIAAGLDSHQDSARTLGIGHRARADLGLERWAPDAPGFAQLEHKLRESLGEDAYQHAHHEGRQLSLNDAVTWIRGARGERARPARGWESLTPTELRVVGLVAEGLTNPEVGERMFISRGTVKVHLSHIFAKLGIGTRSELAAEAIRRDLAS